MTDVVLMLKAMRLAWIPRLLKHANSNWNSVPSVSLRRLCDLNFLLRCNYDIVFLNSKLPPFYKDMLSYFDDLKNLYNYNLGQIVLIILLIARKLTLEYDQMRVTSKIPKNYKQNAVGKTIYII